MRRRAFVIDTDESTVNLLALIVRERGYEVQTFADPSVCPLYGSNSCTCSQDRACGDVLIIGTRFPSSSGIDFIRRQHERGCKGAIRNKAVISGEWTPGELAQAQALGCKIFRKPFVVREISEWLDEREFKTA